MSAKTYFQGYADSLIQSPDNISFSRLVYRMVECNAPAAMILERIAYWHGTSNKTGKPRLNVEFGGKLWLAKNYTDWEEECCVNASTARKALDRLEKLGLIETKPGKFNKLNTLLIRVIPEQFEHLSKMDRSSVQNGHLVSVQNGHFYIQESTKEQLDTTIKETTLVTPNGATVAASNSSALNDKTPVIVPIEPVTTKSKRKSSSIPKTKKEDTPPRRAGQYDQRTARTPPPRRLRR